MKEEREGIRKERKREMEGRRKRKGRVRGRKREREARRGISGEVRFGRVITATRCVMIDGSV